MREPDHKYIASLVTLAQQNSSDAFAELYAMTYNKVYNYAKHYLRDDFLAQDAVQEVYISALKNINKIKDPSLFIAWLNQISFHVCYDMSEHLKTSGGTATDDDILSAVTDERPESNIENSFQNKEEYRRLHEAIETLPINERQCLVMKFYNGMKLDEIASAVGISKSTVKRYIQTAEMMLKQKLMD